MNEKQRLESQQVQAETSSGQKIRKGLTVSTFKPFIFHLP